MSTARMAWYDNKIRSRRPSAGHPRHARHAGGHRRAAARLRPRPPSQTHLRRPPERAAGLPLSGPSPAREPGDAQSRLAGHAIRARGQVLQTHRQRPAQARGRSRRVEGTVDRHRARSGDHDMSWLKRLFGREALERDLDKELLFHVDAATADHVRNGMSQKEARRIARLDLGGIEQVKEETRDARGTRWVEDLVTDVRHAMRGMRRAPALSTAAILTLAIGIGANTSVWSIVDALMQRSLPIERADELYAIRRAGLQSDNYRISYP